MMNKKEIRHIIAQLKRQHTEAELSALSLAVNKSLLNNAKVKAGHTILLYYSMKGEVDTHDLVDTLRRQGKAVLLPKVLDDGKLALIPYTGRENMLEAGSFHILEPQGEPFTNYADIDVAVVPGIAFTADGRRMGRGGGYYDRLLPLLHNTWKIGLCFPFQLMDDIPTEEHDIPMDEIASCNA